MLPTRYLWILNSGRPWTNLHSVKGEKEVSLMWSFSLSWYCCCFIQTSALFRTENHSWSVAGIWTIQTPQVRRDRPACAEAQNHTQGSAVQVFMLQENWNKNHRRAAGLLQLSLRLNSAWRLFVWFNIEQNPKDSSVISYAITSPPTSNGPLMDKRAFYLLGMSFISGAHCLQCATEALEYTNTQ